ncbi:hypothetical protein G6F59_018502 [Rhizopus arrhizus]|nr:hypothetical protein G6F59_018502 [Rhizopus arrhizus]
MPGQPVELGRRRVGRAARQRQSCAQHHHLRPQHALSSWLSSPQVSGMAPGPLVKTRRMASDAAWNTSSTLPPAICAGMSNACGGCRTRRPGMTYRASTRMVVAS